MERHRMRIAELRIEPGKHNTRIEADGARIRPQVTMPIQALSRPATHIVVFQIDQQGRFDFRALGNLVEGETSSLASSAKVGTNSHTEPLSDSMHVATASRDRICSRAMIF